MVIDSHQHVFWWGRDDHGLVRDLDDQGIDVAWVLGWDIIPEEDNRRYHAILNPVNARADGTHGGIPLRDLLLARERHPDRFILGYCPHPILGNAHDLFEAAVRTYGVRVCGEWKFRILFDDPRCLELYRKAGELNCPVVLHLDVPYRRHPEGTAMVYDPLWYGGTVENLERALQACPQTNFIGHAPGFWREISGDAPDAPEVYPEGPVTPGGKLFRLFDSYSNLYADLSAGSALIALRRDPEHARAFMDRYADRLLFGRDAYGNEHQEFLRSLELSEAIRRKIFCENARKLVPVNG